jgi:hypothetical protein
MVIGVFFPEQSPAPIPVRYALLMPVVESFLDRQQFIQFGGTLTAVGQVAVDFLPGQDR